MYIGTYRGSTSQKLVNQNSLNMVLFQIAAKINNISCKIFRFDSQYTFTHHNLRILIVMSLLRKRYGFACGKSYEMLRIVMI